LVRQVEAEFHIEALQLFDHGEGGIGDSLENGRQFFCIVWVNHTTDQRRFVHRNNHISTPTSYLLPF
jgi:hypothetical protein